MSWEIEFHFQSSLISTFLVPGNILMGIFDGRANGVLKGETRARRRGFVELPSMEELSSSVPIEAYKMRVRRLQNACSLRVRGLQNTCSNRGLQNACSFLSQKSDVTSPFQALGHAVSDIRHCMTIDEQTESWRARRERGESGRFSTNFIYFWVQRVHVQGSNASSTANFGRGPLMA